MPLTRERVTIASRIMLPTYATAFTFNGLALLLQDPVRTSGDAFAGARWLMVMPGWGVLFLALVLVEVLAMLTHRRRLEVIALSLGVGFTAFWATLLLISAITETVVSYTSCSWVTVVAIAQYASMRSLEAGER